MLNNKYVIENDAIISAIVAAAAFFEPLFSSLKQEDGAMIAADRLLRDYQRKEVLGLLEFISGFEIISVEGKLHLNHHEISY